MSRSGNKRAAWRVSYVSWIPGQALQEAPCSAIARDFLHHLHRSGLQWSGGWNPELPGPNRPREEPEPAALARLRPGKGLGLTNLYSVPRSILGASRDFVGPEDMVVQRTDESIVIERVDRYTLERVD